MEIGIRAKMETSLSPQQLVTMFSQLSVEAPAKRLEVVDYTHIIETDDLVGTLFRRNNFCVVFYPAHQAGGMTMGHFCALTHHPDTKSIYFYDPLGYKPDGYKRFADRALYQEHQNSLIRHMIQLMDEQYTIDFNQHQHQSRKPSMATCGRHSVLRCIYHYLTNEEYHKMLTKLQAVVIGKPSTLKDRLVANLT